LRESEDEVEAEGIRRSHVTLGKAELILHVLDASEPLTAEDQKYLHQFAGKKRIILRNKMDLPGRLQIPASLGSPLLDVCCLSGQGLETLKDAIKNLVWSGEIRSEMLHVMINSRHQEALQRARAATDQTIATLREEQTLEITAMELRIAISAIGEIVGKTTTEDLLDSIFSTFCLGK
jgi:tRNA modification GTPase